MMSSNRNIFQVTWPFWGESADHRWIPLTKASVTRSLDVLLRKRLSRQFRRRWFETPSETVLGPANGLSITFKHKALNLAWKGQYGLWAIRYCRLRIFRSSFVGNTCIMYTAICWPHDNHLEFSCFLHIIGKIPEVIYRYHSVTLTRKVRVTHFVWFYYPIYSSLKWVIILFCLIVYRLSDTGALCKEMVTSYKSYPEKNNHLN